MPANLVTRPILMTGEGNECACTRFYPLAPYVEGMVDLSKTKTYIMSNDNWMPVTDKVYSVANVEMPEWLSAEEWVRNDTAWKYARAFGLKWETHTPEMARFLAYGNMSQSARYVLIKLMQTKSFRSEFRASMKRQVEAWVATAPENRKYSFPLSPRQLDALYGPHDSINASRIANRTYYTR